MASRREAVDTVARKPIDPYPEFARLTTGERLRGKSLFPSLNAALAHVSTRPSQRPVKEPVRCLVFPVRCLF